MGIKWCLHARSLSVLSCYYKRPTHKITQIRSLQILQSFHQVDNSLSEIQRQSNTTQLARNSHFSKKNWLLRVGFERTTLAADARSRRSYQLSYRGSYSSAKSHTNQSQTKQINKLSMMVSYHKVFKSDIGRLLRFAYNVYNVYSSERLELTSWSAQIMSRQIPGQTNMSLSPMIELQGTYKQINFPCKAADTTEWLNVHSLPKWD